MDPALQEELRTGRALDERIEAVVRLEDPTLIPAGLEPVVRFGSILTCRVRRKDIEDVYNLDAIKSFKASRFVKLGIDWKTEGSGAASTSGTDLRRPRRGLPTGKDTVIGVIDFGFDFTHRNFRNRRGETRLLALWDQSSRNKDSVPLPYGYGAHYSPTDINAALKSGAPFETLRYFPTKADLLKVGAHGTHVTDIAAGNGAIGPSGIAPAADLVFVHLASRTSRYGTLGDSVRILEAIHFIDSIAGDRPLAINLSVGRHGGAHDGNSLVEQGMDEFLDSKKNRVISQSTGNYRKADTHSSGLVKPGRKKTFSMFVDRADVTLNELEVWYAGPDRFKMELYHPDSGQRFVSRFKQNAIIDIDGKVVGRIYHRGNEPNNGKNHVNVFLYPSAPPGRWDITLIGDKIVDGRYHAWIERDGGCPGCQSRFLRKDVDQSTTTGTICNGRRTIAVGAYNGHALDLELASFSSGGPTTDGRLKPDLLAPGVRVLAARSQIGSGALKSSLTRMSGTSMASPHVTGTAALVLQSLERPASIDTIRMLLLGSTSEVFLAGEDPARMGYGILDIERAVSHARKYALKPKAFAVERHAGVHLPDVEQEARATEIGENTHKNEFEAMRTENRVVHTQWESSLSPAQVFDHLTLGAHPEIWSELDRSFELIGLPGRPAFDNIQPGDYVIKRSVEAGSPAYVARIEGSAWSHMPERAHYGTQPEGNTARRLIDQYGNLLYDQMVLRPRRISENQRGMDWCHIRREIGRIALQEEGAWTAGNGRKILESAASRLPFLQRYWRSVSPGMAAQFARESARDANAWSAAFISYVLTQAGLGAAHGFVPSGLHMRYIVEALRNRERSDRNRPIWLYDQIEMLNEAVPEVGDVLCNNRRVQPANGPSYITNHSYARLRRMFWSGGNQHVQPHGFSHTRVVANVIHRNGRRFLVVVGGNETNSVRQRNIETDRHGRILNPARHRLFAIIKMPKCEAPPNGRMS